MQEAEFAEESLSRDAFLCGKLHLWQPIKGYRAATDAVLLADRSWIPAWIWVAIWLFCSICALYMAWRRVDSAISR